MLLRVAAPGVQDCPIIGDKLPLVVISHGRRGLFAGHHDTAETLANAGFVVAAISHPGNNAFDTPGLSLTGVRLVPAQAGTHG